MSSSTPAALPPASQPPAPSSSPAPPPPASSKPPAASSSPPPPPPPQSTPQPTPQPPPPESTPPAAVAPSAAPTVVIQTSVVTIRPSNSPSVIIVTSIRDPNALQPTGNPHSTSTNPAQVQNDQKGKSSALSTGGKTAIAVVIPLVVVALLVIGALFVWRRRKQRKSNEDERRKEVEEYAYNPNHDPTLPAVGMVEDDSGYRGWGNTQTSSTRKASTTLDSRMAYSDSNSNPGGHDARSPAGYSEANSHDHLMQEREAEADSLGALGAAPVTSNNTTGLRRGPSNASSHYSAGGMSENSDGYPPVPTASSHQDYYASDNHGYYQPNPYGNHDPYAPTGGAQPVIRDVSARRNTRIENPSVLPAMGNSGIAQNF